MKKLLALLLAALVLAGCHGARGIEKFQMPEGFDSQTQYEISFWAKNDSNLTQQAIYKRAVEEFEALYPNIKVNLKLYSDYGKIYNDVITNIATHTTPNVCISYPDHIATYLTGSNHVVPLQELMEDERYGLGGSEVRFDAPMQGEIVDKFLAEGQIGGVQYALPFMRSTEACYVNKDFVEKLGYTLPEKLTWEFIWEVSEAAMAKDEEGNFLVNGQKVMIPFIYKSTDNMMIQYLYQSGAPYAGEDGSIGLFSETTAGFLTEISGHAGSGAFSTFKISSYPANLLNAGQCIFAIDSTAGATWMGSDAPLMDIPEDKLVKFETVVMTIPQVDPENPVMISQGPSMCIFNKEDPGEVLASWLFMQYLLTDSVQIAYAQTEGYVPVTEKAQRSETYQDYLSRSAEDNDLYYSIKLDATRLLLENTENTFVTPVFNGSASVRDAAGQLVENVTKSMRRGETVDGAYIEKLFDSVTSLYRLDSLSAATAGGKDTLGSLPAMSAWVLGALAVCWVGLGGLWLRDFLKKKKAATT